MIQQHHRATLADAEARTHELLAAQRQEHEAGLARHLAFIDRYGRAGKGSGQGWVSAAWGRESVTTPSSLWHGARNSAALFTQACYSTRSFAPRLMKQARHVARRRCLKLMLPPCALGAGCWQTRMSCHGNARN